MYAVRLHLRHPRVPALSLAANLGAQRAPQAQRAPHRQIAGRRVTPAPAGVVGGGDSPQSLVGACFGPGGSNVASRGEILLQRNDDWIAVTITVTHVWSDDGYNFKKDKLFYEESQVLERHGKAKPFNWKAEWDEYVTGELEILDPFTPKARLREIVFEVRPAS